MFFRKARLKERLEEECYDYINPIWERYQKEVLNWRNVHSVDEFSVEKENIDIRFWAYDSTDHQKVPIAFFIDFDKALEDHNKKIEEKKREILRVQDEQAKLQKESLEKFEREQYEKLRAKYG